MPRNDNQTQGELAYLDVVQQIAYTCPGALRTLIERMVVRAIRMLAQETCILQTTLNVPVQDGVAEYDLTEVLTDDYCIDHILQVMWCGQCIDHIDSCTCLPCGYEMKGTDCIVMHPCPNGVLPENALMIQAVLIPTYDICVIPDDMMKQQDLILDMATMLLLRMPKQKWTDVRLSEFMKRDVMGSVTELRDQVCNNFTDEAPRVGEQII